MPTRFVPGVTVGFAGLALGLAAIGVSRWPTYSFRSAELRNWLTMSTSQFTARSRGLVGLSVASL